MHEAFEYEVRRHGGRSNSKWRVLVKTASMERARMLFDKEACALRQGTVELVDLTRDVVMSRVSAPGLRRLW